MYGKVQRRNSIENIWNGLRSLSNKSPFAINLSFSWNNIITNGNELFAHLPSKDNSHIQIWKISYLILGTETNFFTSIPISTTPTTTVFTNSAADDRTTASYVMIRIQSGLFSLWLCYSAGPTNLARSMVAIQTT